MSHRKHIWYELGIVLVAAIALLGTSAVSAQMPPNLTVNMGSNSSLGAFLVDAQGMTLYTFKNDTAGVSNCTGPCATLWPPLTVAQGVAPSLAQGIPGRIGTITRADGSLQVIFDDMPLYTYSADTAAGDATGQGFKGVWYVATPATVSLGGNSMLGAFLVDAQDMTLYTFKNDTPGVSNCTGACATLWPPLTVAQSAEPTLELGLAGQLATITRADGSLQVTFNDMPLYTYSSDMAVGDAVGQGYKNLWNIVQPATVEVGSNSSMSSFLVGENGMPLYTFDNDIAGVSNCTGVCATLWPPLTVAQGETPTASSGVTGQLATITRADGTLQVTRNGMPLYYYSKDIVPGNPTGDGFKGVWHVALP